MSQPTNPTTTQLRLVYRKKSDDWERIQADIPPNIYNYFFRELLAGNHGTRAPILQVFMEKLYDACQAAGLKGWDFDNEHKIATILARLNFDESRTTTTPSPVTKRKPAAKKPKQGTTTGASNPAT